MSAILSLNRRAFRHIIGLSRLVGFAGLLVVCHFTFSFFGLNGVMLILLLAVQFLDPVEQYEQRFEQRTTPPALYIPQTTRPPVTFNQPFGSGVTPPKPERRYIDQDGKLITCRNTGPWVYCF